jgi:uroporphyrinogen III methyltransferase/synthase
MPTEPRVYLVGAGPGDPGLITVRGAKVLGEAEVVVYDRLTTRPLLELAPDDAEMIDVGKSAGDATVPQDEINALLVEHGRAGRRVVRLKGGDPFVFGRGGEEAAALLAAGVPFEVVPGVTSAIAVPAMAGIPVTMRDEAQCFMVVTGHEDPSGEHHVDWDAIARTNCTVVILMGIARIDAISAALLAGGRPPDTPAACIRWGTTDRQEVHRTTLERLPHEALASPSVIVIGNAARHELIHDPSEARPPRTP